MRRAAWLAISGVVVAIIVAGCAGSGSGSPAATGIPGAIQVTAKDYSFDPVAVTAGSGGNTFELVNKGATDHELEIVQAGGKVVGTVPAVKPGSLGHVTLNLSPGDYQLVCRLNAHDQLGMKATLSVAGG